MTSTLVSTIARWAREDQEDVDFLSLQSEIDYLAEQLFKQYEPTRAARHLPFAARFGSWIFSAPNEVDQKALYQLVPHLFFLGRDEYESLHLAAMGGPIARWLIDILQLRLDEPNTAKVLRQALLTTWFCPITDSMEIARFYHVNNIEGVDLRPDWRTLRTLGDAQRISDYMTASGTFANQQELERIVLLEDFVGSGDQMKKAVEFAASLPNKPPVLLCPMVICPEGAKLASDITAKYSHVKFDPVLRLPQATFLSDQSKYLTDYTKVDEPILFKNLREIVQRLHPLVLGSGTHQDYGPFGFHTTGGLVIMHTNCPDNSLPIIHRSSDSPWHALFPRSSRL